MEAKAVTKSVVGVFAGLLPPWVIWAIGAHVDFMYHAAYHLHTDKTLESMHEALDELHINKSVFIKYVIFYINPTIIVFILRIKDSLL